MRPGETQFIEMMTRRGWEYQKRPGEEHGKKCYDCYVFQNTRREYEDQPVRTEIVDVDTALHFRKNGRSLIVSLNRERVIDYNGFPTMAATGMSANCMSLNTFYAQIDDLCGELGGPKTPVKPSEQNIWLAVKGACNAG